jgi:formylglycine-generating enzyme
VVGGAANQANYNNGVYAVTQSASYSSSQNYLTDAGAFSNSASAYDTFDQGGNVWEVNDAVIGSSRGLRGGSWSYYYFDSNLRSSFRDYLDPSLEYYSVGFRVASVPEPSTAVLVLMGVGALYLWKRRKSALCRAEGI